MQTKAAITYYGSQKALADELGIRQPSVAVWGEFPPDKRQLQLERLTKGKLKAEPECQARVLGLPLRRASDRSAK